MNGNRIDLWCCMVSQETLVGGPNCRASQRRDVDQDVHGVQHLQWICCSHGNIYNAIIQRERERVLYIYLYKHILLMICSICFIGIGKSQQSIIPNSLNCLNSNPLASLFDLELHYQHCKDQFVEICGNQRFLIFTFPSQKRFSVPGSSSGAPKWSHKL